MLKTSVLLACLAVSTLADGNYFKVLIREIDNPAGTRRDGTPCSEFGFLGTGCNTYLKASVSASGQNLTNYWTTSFTTPVNTHMETRISNLNLVVEDLEPNGAGSFNGFDLHITLATDSSYIEIIDDYLIHIETTQEQGVYTYTSLRDGTLATTVSFAWATNILPPSTTSSPEPTSTGVPFTGTTEAPTTTPKPPVDCSEITDLTTSGVQTIYPDGTTPVSVYCDNTTYGIYTIIQSRGTKGTNYTFDLPIANYSDIYGTPGKGNNFWFGLDNMHKLSNAKDYTLQIDLCCGTKLISKQIYHKFKVDTPENKYKLTANADIAGIGLDYSSSGKDLNAVFATNGTYVLPFSKGECDQFDFYDDDKDIQATAYGGWWFGSCGNNLNGFLYPSRNGNCTVPLSTFDESRMLGVNMRTTSGQGFGGYDVDLQSYDRVRMALFTFDSTTIDRKDDSFCS